MARRYDIEELLWLRDSPLVTKPDKLPPIEEWMGPIPDPTTRRLNHRDQTQTENGTPRRPSLFETGHISRKSNSEDIVLGPPKTAFASASRIHGKSSYDATERPTRFNDSEEGKGDRFNFRDKFFKEREGGDLDKRDSKFANANVRRNDREDWNSGRPRRTFGQDENDQRPKRNGDTGRWDGRDKQEESSFARNLKDKDARLEKEGRFGKRETPLRGRHEASWFRDDTAGEGAELEEEKPFMKSREWRRERQLPDRDWNRGGGRVEQDPEWMDSTDRDEPRQAHTQEDFQRWKEKMKAGSTTPATQAEEKKDFMQEQASAEIQKAEANHLDGELFAANRSQMPVDTGFDRFFGLLGGETKQTVPEAAPSGPLEPNKRDSGSAKASKSSRFAGLFSPPPDTAGKNDPIQAMSQQPDRPASTDADQEGFQRILQMLGGSKSRNTTPQVDSTKQPRPPPYGLPEQNRPTPPPGLPSPSRNPINRQDELMAAQEHSATRGMHHPPPGMDAVLSREHQGHFQERENLLRLMQQVNMSSPSTQHGNVPPPPPQLHQGGHTPGILNVPDLLSRPQGMQQKVPRNQAFLEDPAIANMQRPEHEMKGQQARKPPINGPLPMRYFDEMPPFPGASHGPTTPGVAGSGREPQVPHSHMGLQRPPGFPQVPPGPPPGWAGQMPPQQGALGPPPGIPNPNKGMNPNFLAGPLSMHGGNMPPPPPNENPQFMRGAGAGGNFGLPPGMMPPPGYMNMNGPPPPSGGFMPGPHNPEAMLNVGGGGQNGGPPPSSRHLLEMLAHANGGDGRGAMLGGGPGQYR